MSYFENDANALSVGGRFEDAASSSGFELAPGLTIRPVEGNEVLISFVDFAPNASAQCTHMSKSRS